MTIGLANNTHIPGLIDLLQQVGQVHYDIRPDIFREGAQKYNEADLEALLQDTARPIFVAEEEGRVLGYCFCMLQETKGNPVLRDNKTLYIDDLCVDENCRGKHVGRQLYDYTVAFAREQNYRTVTLNVWCGNDSAMAFYEKRGLKPRNIHMELILEEA